MPSKESGVFAFLRRSSTNSATMTSTEVNWPKLLIFVAVLFALSSYKLLPFSYLLRFYYQVFRHLLFKRRTYNRDRVNTYGLGKRKLDIFRPVAYLTYTSPLEIDMYFHKSNSTYFVDLDIARTKLISVVFQVLFMKYWSNESGEFRRKSLTNCPFIPVGTVQCAFKREFKVFERYIIVSSVFAWDNKWLYVLLKFVLSLGSLSAVAVTKCVFKKRGHITIKPVEYIAECGLLNREAEAVNLENYALVSYLETSDGLDKWAATLDAMQVW